jgi:pyridoxal 5'-phosphate synthase pdxS subunit
MSTPAQTPNGGSPLPTVPHGVGNPSGTPVMAPTRAAPSKDGAGSSLGTFGVRIM